MTIIDAVILAGGRAARLDGADKPRIVVGDRSLLEHALTGAREIGARQIVVVGPPGLVEPPVLNVLEDPPFGGPAAGIAAGLTALERAREVVHECAGDPASASTPAADWILLLACDLPRATAVVGLLGKATSGLDATLDGVCVRDGDGRDQWLAGIYRRTSLLLAQGKLIAGGERGKSVGRLLGGLDLLRIEDPGDVSADVDTWADVARENARRPPGDRGLDTSEDTQDAEEAVDDDSATTTRTEQD